MYLDTSALLKLLVDEAESEDLLRAASPGDIELVTSELSIAELHRSAARLGVEAAETDRLLDQLALVPVTTSLLRRAGRLPWPPDGFLRTADALHVVSAVLADEHELVTYDRRQAQAAAAHGFSVLAPGRAPRWFARDA